MFVDHFRENIRKIAKYHVGIMQSQIQDLHWQD